MKYQRTYEAAEYKRLCAVAEVLSYSGDEEAYYEAEMKAYHFSEEWSDLIWDEEYAKEVEVIEIPWQ